MTRNTKLLVAALCVAIATLVGLVLHLLPDKVRMEITRARYCQQRSDCTLVNATCSTGYQIAINKAEVERIKRLIPLGALGDLYRPMTCASPPPDHLECRREQCVKVWTQPDGAGGYEEVVY